MQDLLFPRVCVVTYSDLCYDDFELNNISNFNNKSEPAVLSTSEVDFDSIWRLSFQRKQKNDKLTLNTQQKQVLSTNASANLPFILEKSKTQYEFLNNSGIQNEIESKKLSQTNENAYQKQKRFDGSKNELYIEYINFINNPCYQPKYLSSTTKLNSLSKEQCSRLFRSSNQQKQVNKAGLIDELEERKKKNNEVLQKYELERLQRKKFLENLALENQKNNKRNQIYKKLQDEPTIDSKTDDVNFNAYKQETQNKLSILPKPKPLPISSPNNVSHKKTEDHEPLYTKVDKLQKQKNNKIPKLAEKSPDIYTEIKKIKENKKIDNDLVDYKELIESNMSIKSSANRKETQKREKSNLKNKRNDKSPENEADKKHYEARKSVTFEDDVTVIELSQQEMSEREIQKRIKEKRNSTSENEIEETVGETQQESNIINEISNKEILAEKETEQEKLPEIDYKFERVHLPEISLKKPEINISKPAKKILITPIVKAEPEKEVEPAREKIDLSKLKPIRPKKIVFEEPEVGEDYEEEEVVYNTDDWLAKWCIFKPNQLNTLGSIFDRYDTFEKGWINGESLIQALEKAVHLNNIRLTYLFNIMCLCGTDPFTNGVDKKVFCIIAALGQRIKHLDDEWFLNLLPRLDAMSIENKMHKVRNLWNFLVDAETRMIHREDLFIEMKAGQVTKDHIEYAREKFCDKSNFDLLDFLTYCPLFINIHNKIIVDPFDEKNPI